MAETGSVMTAVKMPEEGHEVITPPVTLRVVDRCDKANCDAQARVRLWFTVPDQGTDVHLDFCAHHYTAMEVAVITSRPDRIEDGRPLIR